MWRAILESVASDRELIQIVDAAMAEAARLGGAWLVCRPGCAECCLGPFPITQLDARRLREGLADFLVDDIQTLADLTTEANVQSQKVKIATKQWRAMKIAPRIYGDSSGGGQINLYNDEGFSTLYLYGDSGGAAYMALGTTNGLNRLTLDGYGNGGGG